MKHLFFITLFFTLILKAEPIVVAVVDKGIERISQSSLEKNIMREKSYDFMAQSKSQGIDYPLHTEQEPHGSFIAFKILRPFYKDQGIKVLDMVYESDERQAFNYLFVDSSLALYRRKVFYRQETKKIIESFDLSVRQGARVINFSSGSPYFDADTFDQWLKANPEVALVVSAGNEGRDLDKYPHYPCSIKRANLFCVGSINLKRNRSEFSNYGHGIIKALGDHKKLKGTSFAAPEVSRALAIILKNRPKISFEDSRKIIITKFGSF